MACFISNPIFLFAAGSITSFVGSIWANKMFFGKMERARAERETKRAYNKLMNRLVHTSISDINHPLHLLPVEISDRIEDLRYTLTDVNPGFNCNALVNNAIEQAVELRRQQQAKFPQQK